MADQRYVAREVRGQWCVCLQMQNNLNVVAHIGHWGDARQMAERIARLLNEEKGVNP